VFDLECCVSDPAFPLSVFGAQSTATGLSVPPSKSDDRAPPSPLPCAS
jgi:hypothetical protein